MHKKLVTLIGAVLALVMLSPCYAKEWREYTSDNFTIITDQKEEKVKSRILELEAFRSSVLLFLGLENRTESTPAKIFIFDNEKDFRLLTGKNSYVAGYYEYTLDGPIMVLSNLRDEERKGEENIVLFHEYIHYLLRQRSSLNYPRWYEEGLCDLLGATQIRDGKALIGQSNTWRHWATKRNYFRVPIEDLVSTPPSERDHKYYRGLYTTGWLFTHYLLLGKLQGQPDYTAGLSAYLKKFSAGDMSLEAFESSLGVKAKSLNKELKRYAKNKNISGLSIPVPEYTNKIIVRNLDQAESTYHKAVLLELNGKESKAQYFLKKVPPSSDPFYNRTISLQAIYEGHDENFDKAFQLLEKALKASPNDYQVLVDAAHLYSDYIEHLSPEKPWSDEVSSYYETGFEFADKAYNHPQKTASAARHRRTYFEQKEDTINTLRMYMEQYRFTPHRISLNEEIGNVLARTSKPELALPFLEKVIFSSHDEDKISEIAELIKKIKTGDKIPPLKKDK